MNWDGRIKNRICPRIARAHKRAKANISQTQEEKKVNTANKQSLLSVIIPVYNCERYLAEAIESVLIQDHRPIEIIVIDDGSTDGSAAVAAKFGQAVRYCFQQHEGISAARNRGIGLAGGMFVSFLDADDIWVQNKLALQMAAFEKEPGLDMAFGLVKNFRSPELPETLKATIHCPDELMPAYFASALVTKRDVFSRVGLFETGWHVGEFIDWFLRAQEMGISVIVVPELVTLRRLYKTGTTSASNAYFSTYTKILKASLDRRRRA